MTKNLEIAGMHCQHCVHAVREALEDLRGVAVRNVSIGKAEIDVDEAVRTEDIERAVAEEGYTVTGGL